MVGSVKDLYHLLDLLYLLICYYNFIVLKFVVVLQQLKEKSYLCTKIIQILQENFVWFDQMSLRSYVLIPFFQDAL